MSPLRCPPVARRAPLTLLLRGFGAAGPIASTAASAPRDLDLGFSGRQNLSAARAPAELGPVAGVPAGARGAATRRWIHPVCGDPGADVPPPRTAAGRGR